MKIDLIPELTERPNLIDAHKESKLIVFVGAGVSALWGCLRWHDMASKLIDGCVESGRLDYWEREMLMRRYRLAPRKLITIAQNILDDKSRGEKLYINALKKTLGPKPHLRDEKYPELFRNLFALNAAFITTNIDEHFSKYFDGDKIHIDAENFETVNLQPKNIFHLHGAISNPDSLVMTVDEYVKRYKIFSETKFLDQAFFHENEYRFLFIGYGVDEMEIIDYMIEKYSHDDKSARELKARSFYVLLPFYRNEEPLLAHEESYFKRINMHVIPYAIDSNGYGQLYEVINEWKRQLVDEPIEDHAVPYNKLIDRNL